MQLNKNTQKSPLSAGGGPGPCNPKNSLDGKGAASSKRASLAQGERKTKVRSNNSKSNLAKIAESKTTVLADTTATEGKSAANRVRPPQNTKKVAQSTAKSKSLNKRKNIAKNSNSDTQNKKPNLPISKPKKLPKNIARSLYNAKQAQNRVEAQKNTSKNRPWSIRVEHLVPQDPTRFILGIAKTASLCFDGYPYMFRLKDHINDKLRKQIEFKTKSIPPKRNVALPFIHIKKHSFQCVSAGAIEACVVLRLHTRYKAISMRIENIRMGSKRWKVEFLDSV